MNKHEDYYCGARWFPRWLRKLLSKHFNTSCQWHDERYKEGGDKQDRFYVDLVFLADMERESPHKKKTAKLYYLLVRAFGWMRFK